VQQFSDKDPQFVSIRKRTSCLDIKSETANDVLAEQNASEGWKEVTNWANWRIRAEVPNLGYICPSEGIHFRL